jgi:hypothetical protein
LSHPGVALGVAGCGSFRQNVALFAPFCVILLQIGAQNARNLHPQKK